jgi:hypothetical protein
MKTTLFVIAFAVILAGATLAQAQTVLDQTGPIGSVGWSTSAVFCKIHPGSAASTLSYVDGTVKFTSTSSGTILLVCPVPGIMNGVPVGNINAFGLNFLDASGQTGGCTVNVTLTNRTTRKYDFWTSGQSFSGSVWTANVPMTGNTYPLNTSDNYDVDIYLYRPASAVGVCNPTAYGVFLEYVIF